MRIIYPCEKMTQSVIKPKQEISRYQNNIRKDNCVLGKDKSKQTQQRLLNCGDCAHHFCSIGFFVQIKDGCADCGVYGNQSKTLILFL